MMTVEARRSREIIERAETPTHHLIFTASYFGQWFAFVARATRPAPRNATGPDCQVFAGRARLATGLAEWLADAVRLLRHARQSFEMARCLGRSKLDRPLVPLTGFAHVRTDA